MKDILMQVIEEYADGNEDASRLAFSKYLREKMQTICNESADVDELLDEIWENSKDDPRKLKQHERLIAKSAKYSYMYATQILNKARFKLGESIIAKHPDYAYMYALYVLKGRFEEGESTIMKSANKDKYIKLLDKKGISHGF